MLPTGYCLADLSEQREWLLTLQSLWFLWGVVHANPSPSACIACWGCFLDQKYLLESSPALKNTCIQWVGLATHFFPRYKISPK